MVIGGIILVPEEGFIDPKQNDNMYSSGDFVNYSKAADWVDAGYINGNLPIDWIETNLYNNADKERKNFFEALNKINRERQSRLTLSISNTLGIYSAAPAIAEIIHDVHILGDYTTTNIDGLPSVNNIKDSLLRSSTALIGYRNPSEKLRSLEREFKYAIDKAARGGDDRNKALNLIEAAKQFVPKILHERFYNDLSKKGISIRANKC